jgi:hypothetical protein
MLPRRTIANATWAEIRTAHASGIGLREIARNMGIPAGTILSRAKREGWTREIQNAKALAKRVDAAPAVTTVHAVAGVDAAARRAPRRAYGEHCRKDSCHTSKQWSLARSSIALMTLTRSTRLAGARLLSDSDSHGNNLLVNIAILGIKPEEVMVEGRDA